MEILERKTMAIGNRAKELINTMKILEKITMSVNRAKKLIKYNMTADFVLLLLGIYLKNIENIELFFNIKDYSKSFMFFFTIKLNKYFSFFTPKPGPL